MRKALFVTAVFWGILFGMSDESCARPSKASDRDKTTAEAVRRLDATPTTPPIPHPYKNLIILISDGAGVSHTTLARWIKGASLATDEMNVGMVRAYSSDSLVTDSAAAGTAFACGYKTRNGVVGISPEGSKVPGAQKLDPWQTRKPVANVLEGAKLAGKSVGIVVTCELQDATPASYSAHALNRDDLQSIAEQQVYEDVDLMFGGGKRWLLPEGQGGSRSDGENLIVELRARDVTVIEDRDAMMKAASLPIWGVFAQEDLAYELDRVNSKKYANQPSLAEMTQKAIVLLSSGPEGFLLVVEGSKIDRASHLNDAVGTATEYLAFDAAAQHALEFAKIDKRTAVLVFSDHECGGLSVGKFSAKDDSNDLGYDELVEVIARATRSAHGVAEELGADISPERIHSAVATYWGIHDLSDLELREIAAQPPGRVELALGRVFSGRAPVGWATTNHTAADVVLYTFGIEADLGTVENTEIAELSANVLGFELVDADRHLFVEATRAFDAVGAKTRLDIRDPKNPVFIAESVDARRAELPINKDILRLISGSGTSVIRLDGVTVQHSQTGKIYASEEAALYFGGAD